MKKIHSKYILIGGGLSGLVTAYELLKSGEENFIVLEGNQHAGGRILTQNHIDLGATWFQTYHQNLLNLLQELSIEKFEQFNTGKNVLVYSTMSPEHYFETDKNSPPVYRIVGGSSAIVSKLVQILKDKIICNAKVLEIKDDGDSLKIATETTIYTSEKAIVSMPPKMANGLRYVPEISAELKNNMLKTHTWMSNAIKVGLVFKTPFWKEKGLSGTIIGQVGAVIEMYDHSNYSNTVFALKGFVNEGLRVYSSEERKERILTYLQKYFGEEIREYIHYEEKDWSQDSFVSCENVNSVYMSPEYGKPIFQKDYMDGKLVFSGTETAAQYGGYLEGAVFSGIVAFKKLKKID